MLQSMHPQVLCWSPFILNRLSNDVPMMQTTFEKLQALAGVPLAQNEVAQVIALLGGQAQGSDLSCPLPSWRFDLPLEQNFLAEILRAYGIDRITLPPNDLKGQRKIVCVEPALSPWIERGFNEVVTYSFGPKDWALISTKEEDLIELKNPLNQDLSVMRPSLWPSLLEVLASNQRCGGKGLGVVEMAPIYQKDFPLLQKKVVSAVLYLQRPTVAWNASNKSAEDWSYYAIKGLVEQIGLAQAVTWVPLATENPFLHPTLSAALMQEEHCVGLIGLIHPALAEQFHWPQSYLIQLDAQLWESQDIPSYKSFSKYQKVHRDFSFICPSSVAAKDILAVFRANVENLKSLEVFDYYSPEGALPTLGVSAIFQSAERTLGDFEVNTMITKALEALKNNLGAFLKSEEFL